ncbi:MAG: rRNA maturation RNase YbeY [Prosthecobacter sp.]|nr:rRNA maturation RNase YbeY [Prosthecobacter sp.]
MALPKIRIYNRQGKHRPNLPWLRRTVKAALPACLESLTGPSAPLAQLAEIEITIISDGDIALVHADFLNDPTPTDVITFHHGEILVSADTALRQGAEHGQPLDQELALYMIHGLLHLAGWDDHDPDEAARMAARQFTILREATSAAN